MADDGPLPPGFGDDEVEAGAPAAPPPAKRRRRHRQSTLLPKRPKKPMSGYTLFLRNYFNTHPREAGVSSHEMLKRASQTWRGMGADQKQQYQELCAPDIERYNREMELWKRQKTALKRPPSAYAMFVKDFWARKTAAGEVNGGVREMGTNCKQAWDAATEEVKNQYRVRYTAASEAYKTRLAGIHNGEVNLVDLVNAVGAPAAPPPEAEAAEGGENDDQEEEQEGAGPDDEDEEGEGAEADADADGQVLLE